MNKQYTQIRVSKKLRSVLKKIGRKEEQYEDIIWRLIKEAGYDIKKL